MSAGQIHGAPTQRVNHHHRQHDLCHYKFCARLTVAPSLVMTITTTPFAPPSLCSGGESALLRVLEVGGHPRIGPVRVLSISNGGFEMRRPWIQYHATPACLCHCCSNVLQSKHHDRFAPKTPRSGASGQGLLARNMPAAWECYQEGLSDLKRQT